ncbi:MAG: DNA double-strand break repair nuclease NurA [Thermoplasmata archaeon]
MNENEIKEARKRIDFKKTYSETAVQLINDAIEKGKNFIADINVMRNNVEIIFEKIKQDNFLKNVAGINVNLNISSIVGIDGSCYPIEGIGGRWYVPICVARIVFKGNQYIHPETNVTATIIIINEIETPNVMGKSIEVMLQFESLGIKNWGATKGSENSLLLLDGPIIDPPFQSKEKYIKERCDSIKVCFNKKIVVAGCVKNVKDKFFLKEFEKRYEDIKSNLKNFPSDHHLMTYLFTHFRRKNYIKNGIYTEWIDLPIDDKKLNTQENEEMKKLNGIYRRYRDEGIGVLSLFYQKELRSKVIRIDIPYIVNEKINEEKILNIIKKIDEMVYPMQSIPLPVLLAHERCKIRGGFAEILYNEILTRGKSVEDVESQILISHLG